MPTGPPPPPNPASPARTAPAGSAGGPSTGTSTSSTSSTSSPAAAAARRGPSMPTLSVTVELDHPNKVFSFKELHRAEVEKWLAGNPDFREAAADGAEERAPSGAEAGGGAAAGGEHGKNSRQEMQYYDCEDPFIDDTDLDRDPNVGLIRPKIDGFFVCHGEVETVPVEKPRRPPAPAAKRGIRTTAGAARGTPAGRKRRAEGPPPAAAAAAAQGGPGANSAGGGTNRVPAAAEKAGVAGSANGSPAAKAALAKKKKPPGAGAGQASGGRNLATGQN